MSVSSLNGYNAYNPLAAALAKSGASSSATSQVSSEAETLAKSTSTNGTPPDPQAMRAALDKQIASDVQSGTISQDDADKISAALDQLDSQLKSGGPRGGGRPSGPPPGGGAGGPPPGGGAGDPKGASSSKSALEEMTELLKSSTNDEDDSSSSSSTSSTSSTDLTSYLTNLLKSKKVDFSA